VKLLEMARSEREASDALKRAQSQMLQTEKLAALGQLVAGVAHEINNPLSFVGNNVAVLQRDLKAVRELLELYRTGDELLEASKPELMSQIRELADRIDLAYTMGNLDELLVRSREGLRRIQQIVKDLRDFARLDESDLQEADLNQGIESTVNIVHGRAKGKHVTLELDLHPLPPVVCYPAKINQVVMNLVTNAIDACDGGGTVTVRTSELDHGAGVRIDVVDTGAGVPANIRERIFDPFFTTKPQGEGTGLGLSISYGIVKDHYGTIDVDSTPGKGSTFTVKLPRRSLKPRD
jgi:signal transduction histidine kinase